MALAAPEAEADALYGAYGYSALPAYPALYNAYPNWPGYSLPGFSRTLYGARGKRSAEAEAEADAYYPAYGYGLAAFPTSYSGVASTFDWPGIAAPGFSSTLYGARGKRSADAEADADAYYYGLTGYSGYSGYAGYGYAGYPYRAAYGYGYPYRYGGYRY